MKMPILYQHFLTRRNNVDVVRLQNQTPTAELGRHFRPARQEPRQLRWANAADVRNNDEHHSSNGAETRKDRLEGLETAYGEPKTDDWSAFNLRRIAIDRTCCAPSIL